MGKRQEHHDFKRGPMGEAQRDLFKAIKAYVETSIRLNNPPPTDLYDIGTVFANQRELALCETSLGKAIENCFLQAEVKALQNLQEIERRAKCMAD